MGDEGRSVATDLDGNVYVTGSFNSTIDFDPGPGVTSRDAAAGIYSAFCSKFDQGGNFIWVDTWGGEDDCVAGSVETDQSGNLCVTGSFRGIADLDPGPDLYERGLAHRYSQFISLFDSSGELKWAHIWTLPMDYYADSLSLDSFGNVYITGWFDETEDFDPTSSIDSHTATPGPSDYSYDDAYLIKLLSIE